MVKQNIRKWLDEYCLLCGGSIKTISGYPGSKCQNNHQIFFGYFRIEIFCENIEIIIQDEIKICTGNMLECIGELERPNHKLSKDEYFKLISKIQLIINFM